MVKLFCAIVGVAGSVFSVEIDENATVYNLKQAIKNQKRDELEKINAYQLQLFLAKTPDGKWLSDDGELGKMLSNKVVISDMKKLRATSRLNDAGLRPDDSLGEDVVHVLVVVPKQEVAPAHGLYLEIPHLPRVELVQEVYNSILATNIVLLSSPSGSGKTSLLMLFARQFPQLCYIPIPFYHSEDATALLNSEGVDLVERKCWLPDDKTWIFLLDNCQRKYGDVMFWDRLLKGISSRIPNHVRFIISATSLLEGDFPASPDAFANTSWKLTRDDFLISDAEAHECLRMENGLPTEFLHFSTLLEVIVRQCNGHIGALRVSINGIREHFKPRKGETCPSEHEVLAYFLSESFLETIPRCFGSAHPIPINPDHHAFLTECLLSDPDRQPLVHTLTRDELECFKSLQKSGIVTDVGGYVKFTSPIAERYYYQWLFPTRARENPTSLHELILKAIGGMSATALKQSVARKGDFPKETVFQHQFMTTLTQFTTCGCFVCPELSRSFPDSPRTPINGGIDFYLSGSLAWGIELHANGNKIDEQLSRFGRQGKCAALAAEDYAVIDFQCNKTGKMTRVTRNPKRVTVYFKLGDFSSCRCIFGLAEDQVRIVLNH